MFLGNSRRVLSLSLLVVFAFLIWILSLPLVKRDSIDLTKSKDVEAVDLLVVFDFGSESVHELSADDTAISFSLDLVKDLFSDVTFLESRAGEPGIIELQFLLSAPIYCILFGFFLSFPSCHDAREDDGLTFSRNEAF